MSSNKCEVSYRAICCDDIRQESNGKYILIGVYPTDILVETPVKLALSFLITIDNLSVGEHEIEFVFTGPFLEEAKPTKLGIALTVQDDTKPSTIYTPRLPIDIETTGILRVSARPKNGDESEIAALLVASPKSP